MAQKRLVDYIRNLLQKGHNITAIRNVLLKSGYTDKEIDDAVKSAYSPTVRHEIHLSGATIIVVVLILASMIGIASLFFYYSSAKAPSELLDLNLEPVSTTAEPGESIVFLKELSNLGSSKRYDVVIKQEIIEPRTNKAITQKTETRAIETFGSTQTKILVPEGTNAGDYILRVVVEYSDKKAVATLPVKIAAPAKKETCVGDDCKQQALECDDSNSCTNDVVEEGVCSYKPIVPCCGNSICEATEDSLYCPTDCKKEEQSPSIIPPADQSPPTLDEIKELAKSEPGRALQQCSQIEVPDLKDTCIGNIGEVQRNKAYCGKISSARIRDLCYSNIAKAVNDNSLCEEISIDGRKDSCYMTFVLDNKDYSVCGKITNRQLMQSCESLRQLNELSQQIPAINGTNAE